MTPPDLYYIHKQLPLHDEELRCRHGAETLVDCDEEEDPHPGGTEKQNLIIESLCGIIATFSRHVPQILYVLVPGV